MSFLFGLIGIIISPGQTLFRVIDITITSGRERAFWGIAEIAIANISIIVLVQLCFNLIGNIGKYEIFLNAFSSGILFYWMCGTLREKKIERENNDYGTLALSTFSSIKVFTFYLLVLPSLVHSNTTLYNYISFMYVSMVCAWFGVIIFLAKYTSEVIAKRKVLLKIVTFVSYLYFFIISLKLVVHQLVVMISGK